MIKYLGPDYVVPLGGLLLGTVLLACGSGWGILPGFFAVGWIVSGYQNNTLPWLKRGR